jgi:hypothetical protein
MNLLFITEIQPFPVFGGERIRTYGLIKIFSELGYNTLAIIGKTKNNESKNYSFKNVSFLEVDFLKLKKVNRLKSIPKRFKLNSELVHLFKKAIDRHKCDVVYIDYEFYGQYVSVFKKLNLPVIYGTHNAQSKITLQRPWKTYRNRLTNYLVYLSCWLHEIIYFRRADALIVVSEDDKNYYKKYINDKKIYVIPNFLNDEDYKINIKKKEDYIIMTGNFKVFQNSAGLEWFLGSIWNKELSDKCKFIVVGLGSKEIAGSLKYKYSLSNVEAYGEVDDIKPYIAKSKIAIVPLLHGSGTRLKCIEAMALKTQIISTSKGAEGINHNGSILIADNPRDFRNNILEVLDDKINTTNEAFHIFMNIYSLEPNKIIFKSIVKNLLT